MIQINIDPDHGIHKLIDPTSTNDWDILTQLTQILLIPFLNKRGDLNNAKMLTMAKSLWYKQSMVAEISFVGEESRP